MAVLATGPALAQPAASTDESAGNQTIVVVAPRKVPVPTRRSPYTSAPVVTTTVSVAVLYGDLDLTGAKGVERLNARVNNVARDACRQLDRLFPFHPDPECLATARANGAAAAQAAISAARAGKP